MVAEVEIVGSVCTTSAMFVLADADAPITFQVAVLLLVVTVVKDVVEAEEIQLVVVVVLPTSGSTLHILPPASSENQIFEPPISKAIPVGPPGLVL